MEALEERWVPATLTVNSLVDNTTITSALDLREAMTLVNNAGDPSSLGQSSIPAGWASQINGTFGSNDTIQFDSSLSGATIALSTSLPTTTANVTITGPSGGLTIDGGGAHLVSIGDVVNISKITFAHGGGSTGAGIFNNGTLTLTDCTFIGNAATYIGGAIFNFSTLTCEDCTFSGNSAYQGGGIDNQGTTTLTDCTLSGNSASNAGGGLVNQPGETLNITNTLCGGNTAPAGQDMVSESATINDGGYNLFTDPSYVQLSNGVNHDQIGVNAVLGALGSYGGPVQTIPLLPGSPAIDAGTGSSVDARGIAVVNSVRDIGSFESQGFTLTKTSGDSQSTTVSTAFANPLKVTVASSHNEPVQGGVVTFAAPNSGASAALSATTATIAADGTASVTATANATAGGPYNVTASASGATASPMFALTNQAVAPPVTVTANTGNLPITSSTITINGSGFSATASNDTVAFSGAAGTGVTGHVTAATATSLTVTFDTKPTTAGELDAVVTVSSTGSGSPVQVATVTVPTPLTATVNSLADNTSDTSVLTLRDAIELVDGLITISSLSTQQQAQVTTNASGGSAIQFNSSLAGGTITLNGTVLPDLSTNVTITAPTSGITLDGAMMSRILNVDNGVTAAISDVTFTNGAYTTGAGIFTDGMLTLTGCTFSGNSASSYGGGIENYGTLAATDCTFTGNHGATYSGALDNVGPATLTDCTFSGNTSGGYGGAIDNYYAPSSNWYGSATIIGCTISGNTAAYSGGGIYNYKAALTLTNSTLAGNTSEYYGGGIYHNGGSVSIVNSTIVLNQAPAYTGGGIYNDSGSMTLNNTLVAGNTEASGTPSDIYGTVTGSNNLIGDSASAGGFTNGSNGNIVGNSGSGTLALASVIASTSNNGLANNGGPTLTVALAANSPAINAGSNALAVDANSNPLQYDQRGTPHARILGGTVDIGAFEAFVNPTVTVSTATIQANATGITINGTNFDTNAANDSVTFSSGTGHVTKATSTALTVAFDTAPTAGELDASVTVDGGTSGEPKQVATVQPVVSASGNFLPANASGLTIGGYGFDTTASSDSITFNDGAVGHVMAATPTTLTVVFDTKPASAGSLTAIVTTDGVASASPAPEVSLITPVVTVSTANLAINSPTITIAGFGFAGTASNNTVTFNDGAAGTVTSASPTSLTVTFSTPPTLPGSLTASVVSNGLPSNGGTPVQVANLTPVVTSSTASLAITAPSVVISGFGFDTTAANNTVVFSDGAQGNVSLATSTSLTVTFTTKPTSVGSLTAVVTTDNVSSGAAVQIATVAPVVTVNTANVDANATSIVIQGSGFDPSGNNTVVLNDGAFGSVSLATSSSLTVNFSTKPNVAGSLTAVVTTDGVSSGAPVQVGTATLQVPLSPPIIAMHGAPAVISLSSLDPNPNGPVKYTVTFTDPLFALRNQYAFTFEPGLFNYYGRGEQYLLSQNGNNPAGNGFYVLMPSGNIYAWNGDINSTLASTPVTSVAPSVYANPLLLTSNTGSPLATDVANASYPVDSALYNLKINLGLVNPVVPNATNLRGDNEKYLQSTNGSNPAGGGYFVLMPDNKLYAWDNGSLATLQLVADFNAAPYSMDVYDHPSLLTSAQLPTIAGVTAATGSQFGGQLTLTPAPGFDRSVKVKVVATDSTHSTTKLFMFSVTDTPPSIPDAGAVSTVHDSSSTELNLGATSSQPSPLTYTALVAGYSPFYTLETEYGLTQPPIASATNMRHDGELYLQSTNGSNPAGNGQYVLTPSDQLYAYVPDAKNDLLATLSGVPVADFTQDPYDTVLNGGSVYANPALLDQAPFPALPTVAQNSGALYNIREKYGLSTPDIGFNLRGQSETYFQSQNGSNYAGQGYYVLFPDGLLYPWDGVSLATTMASSPVANLSALGVYAHTALLYQAQPLTVNDAIFNEKESLGLTLANIATSLRGQNELYFRSTNGSNPAGGGYYVLFSNNKLYAYVQDAKNDLNATLAQPPVFNFTPYGNVYTTPALLYADNGQLSAVTAAVDGAGNLTISQNVAYVGTAIISATASDGAESASVSFPFSSTDTPVPIVQPSVPSITIASTTETANTVTVTTTAANSLAVGQAVAISTVNIPGYDGIFTIVNANSTSFQYIDPVASLSSGSGGTVTPLASITSASESGSTVKITVAHAPSPFVVGEQVLIAGVSNNAYNGVVTITSVSGSSFKYTANVTGLPSSSGGTAAPVVTPVSASGSSVSIALNAINPDGAPLQYSATLSANPLYTIQQQFGLTAPDISSAFNLRGDNEKYFKSTNGSNPAGGGYFVLMPNNVLYPFVPDAGNDLTATLAGSPVADFAPFANVYANTTLLYQAVVSSLTNVNQPSISNQNSGGTLNLSWISGYKGTFRVTVDIGDGPDVTQQQFLVTVS